MDTMIVEPQDYDAIRADLRRAMEQDGLSQADAAKRAGIGYSTISAFLNGSYKGDNAKVAADVTRWLTARQSQKVTAARVTSSPEWVETPTARDFLAAMEYAQIAADMTLIVGPPGIGKTRTARRYRDRTPNVWLATMQPMTSRPSAMLGEICTVMNVMEKGSTRQGNAIGKHVQGKGGLLILDEGQHLSSEAMDQLRTLNDLFGLGVVVMGNETVVSRLEGQKAAYSQLYSRIGVRLRKSKSAPADIAAMIDAWGINDAAEVDYLTTIARKPGALRTLDKTLRLASALAAGGGEDRALRHVKAAWTRLAPDATA